MIISYHRALMVTHRGCPQTPGGRIRALGFASTRPPSRPDTGDVSVSGLAGIRTPIFPTHARPPSNSVPLMNQIISIKRYLCNHIIRRFSAAC